MDREDFLSTVSLCLYAHHPVQQDETLAKAPGANNVGVLVLPPFRFIGLNSKISSTKVDDEWWNIFCSLQKHSINALVFLKKFMFTNALILCQTLTIYSLHPGE